MTKMADLIKVTYILCITLQLSWGRILLLVKLLFYDKNRSGGVLNRVKKGKTTTTITTGFFFGQSRLFGDFLLSKK